MSLLLREYCGYNVDTSINASINFKESSNSALLAPSPDTLMVEVEGIHAYPFYTRNHTRYMPDALKRSEKKWTTPYLRPLIKHHNDQNGEIIGRIYDARYTESTSVKNVGGLVFTVSVPDEKAAKDVESRILDTVSIGVEANDVRCSICGSHIIDAKEGCPEGHARGESYDGQVCCWDVYDIEPKELSYVIVPSDIYAMNRKVYRVKDANGRLNNKEAFNNPTQGLKLKEETNNNVPNNGGTNPSMDEQKLKEAEAKVEELTIKLETLANVEQENEELKKQVADLQEKIQKALDDLKAKEEDLKAKEEELQVANDTIQVSKEDLTIANQEKKEAERVGMEAQESYRSVLNDMINLYRNIFNKPELKEEELAQRSIDSISDSIKDFKEEYKTVMDQKKALELKEGFIPNPVPPKSDVPLKTPKDPDYKTVNLSEDFASLFNQVLR